MANFLGPIANFICPSHPRRHLILRSRTRKSARLHDDWRLNLTQDVCVYFVLQLCFFGTENVCKKKLFVQWKTQSLNTSWISRIYFCSAVFSKKNKSWNQVPFTLKHERPSSPPSCESACHLVSHWSEKKQSFAHTRGGGSAGSHVGWYM